MSEQPLQGPIPVLTAMLLCDMVITDPDSRKKTLVGIFSLLRSLQFPTRRTMAVYARLTDAQGRYVFRLELVDIERDRVLADGVSDPAEIRDRLSSFDFALPITVTLENPGLYEFRLYANNAYLGRTTFTAVAIDSKGG